MCILFHMFWSVMLIVTTLVREGATIPWQSFVSGLGKSSSRPQLETLLPVLLVALTQISKIIATVLNFHSILRYYVATT